MEIPPEPLHYTIVVGDSLYQLAKIFNTTVPVIAGANNIPDPGLIRVRTTITIPGWFQVRYIVRPQDTLYTIAGQFNAPLNLITRVNQISNPVFIFPGQPLNIPQRPTQVAEKNRDPDPTR